MGTERDEIEKIMILGGGRVGYKVAKELSSEGYKVKLVEIDANKAENIANSLSNVLVLNIDGTRVDLLSEENLEDRCLYCYDRRFSKEYYVIFNG